MADIRLRIVPPRKVSAASVNTEFLVNWLSSISLSTVLPSMDGWLGTRYNKPGSSTAGWIAIWAWWVVASGMEFGKRFLPASSFSKVLAKSISRALNPGVSELAKLLVKISWRRVRNFSAASLKTNESYFGTAFMITFLKIHPEQYAQSSFVSQ